MTNENGAHAYKPHDLAPELDDLSTAYARLQAENAALRARLDTVLHNGDMERARMVGLFHASTGLLNQLALLTRDDESYLWKIGGRPLDNAYKELKRATANVRSDADALLAELDAARAFIHKIRIVPIIGGWTEEQSTLLADYDKTRKARGE